MLSRNPEMPHAEDDASLNVNLMERKTVPTDARQAMMIKEDTASNTKGKAKTRKRGLVERRRECDCVHRICFSSRDVPKREWGGAVVFPSVNCTLAATNTTHAHKQGHKRRERISSSNQLRRLLLLTFGCAIAATASSHGHLRTQRDIKR